MAPSAAESGKIGRKESKAPEPHLITINPETDPFAAPLLSAISFSPDYEVPEGTAPEALGSPSLEGIGTGCDGDEALPADGTRGIISGCGDTNQRGPSWPGEPAYASDATEDAAPEVAMEDMDGWSGYSDENEVPAAAGVDGVTEEDRTARELKYKGE